MTPRELSVGLQCCRYLFASLLVYECIAVPRVRVSPRRAARRYVYLALAREVERLDDFCRLAYGEALSLLADPGVERCGGTIRIAGGNIQAHRLEGNCGGLLCLESAVSVTISYG